MSARQHNQRSSSNSKQYDSNRYLSQHNSLSRRGYNSQLSNSSSKKETRRRIKALVEVVPETLDFDFLQNLQVKYSDKIVYCLEYLKRAHPMFVTSKVLKGRYCKIVKEREMSMVIQYTEIKRQVESVYIGPLDPQGNSKTQPSAVGEEKQRCQTGIMIFERGTGIYIGEWQDGRYHGLGTYQEASGIRYEGGWSKGLMHGHGKFSWPREIGYIFIGEFREDKRIQGKIYDQSLTLV